MQSNDYRITGTVGTIPQSLTVTGTITVSAYSNFHITYTGTEQLDTYLKDGFVGAMGYGYLYVESATGGGNKIAKVLGLSRVNDTTWGLEVDRDLSGVSGDSFEIINTPLIGFSYLNDGGADGTVNGITVHDTEGLSQPQPIQEDQGMGALFRPIYIDASSTDFLINEIIP